MEILTMISTASNAIITGAVGLLFLYLRNLHNKVNNSVSEEDVEKLIEKAIEGRLDVMSERHVDLKKDLRALEKKIDRLVEYQLGYRSHRQEESDPKD